MSKMISRRLMIYGLGGSVVALGTGGYASSLACGWRSQEARAAASRLTVAIQDIFHPERLARWYLAQTDRSSLDAALDAPGDLAALSRIECPASRRVQIAARIRLDFVNGDILVADRIVASRTECLISAVCLSDGIAGGQGAIAPADAGAWPPATS